MTTSTAPELPGAPMVCPVCHTGVAHPRLGRCVGCGADLTDPAFAEILELDRRWAELATRRRDLLARLAATRATAPVPPPPPPGATHASPSPAAPAQASPSPAAAITGAARDASAHRWGVPALLALSGVALLTAAAVVFTAVAWNDLTALGQALILGAATLAAVLAALGLQRRGRPTAAAALGLLAVLLVAVDVVGLERSGLLALGAFTLPVGAVGAAVAGWALARADLHWVSTAGAAAVIVAAVSTTWAVGETLTTSTALLALAAAGLAVAAAATLPAWGTRPARVVAAVGAATWMTVAGLIGVDGLAATTVGLAAGVGVVALPVLLLLVGGRRHRATLAPATLLATLGAVATAGHLGTTGPQAGVVAAAVVALVAAVAVSLPPPRRWPVLVGAAPVALGVAVTVLEAGVIVAARWGATALGGGADALDPWTAATVVLAGAALLAVPRLRAAPVGIGLAVAVVVVGALPAVAAWPALLVLAVAAGAPGGRRTGEALALLGVAAVGVGWAAEASWTVAIAAATTGGLAVWVARAGDVVRGGIGTVVALAAGGLAVGAAADALAAPVDVALGVGLIAVLAGAVAVARRRGAGPATPAPAVAGLLVAGLATLVVPAAASSLRAGGVLLLVAATGWLAIAVVGPHAASWGSAVVASAGVTALLADAGVDVVEAYTVAPSLALAGAGVWWLAEDRAVRTLAALAPALAVALLPSLLLLSADPRALGRTLGLALAAGLLAAVGVWGRWLAPVVAGAATGLWVAVTQLWVAVELVPRWVTFAVVGLLLVWLAATYEAQLGRVRAVRARAHGLR